MNKKTSSGLLKLSAAIALSVAALTPVQADEVRVPIMDQANRNDSQHLPRTGQSQDAVRSSLGEPQRIVGPVGEPPITQWHYSNFVVYFEGQNVIHAVMNPGQ